MELDEVIDICRKYKEVSAHANYAYGYTPEEYIEAAEKLKVLGMKWGERWKTEHFRVTRGYYLTNSATHYKQDKNAFYVQWDNGNVGRLQFVRQEFYESVGDEWQEFLEEMRSYNPLDYDPLNCHIIYDVENGKRVMDDYKEICDRTMEKMRKKIKVVEIERMERELEKLKSAE